MRELEKLNIWDLFVLTFFYVLCVWCICNPLGIGGALATSSGSTSAFGLGN